MSLTFRASESRAGRRERRNFTKLHGEIARESLTLAAVEQTPDKWLQRFKVVAWLEGLSFLLLIGIAMPLKYWMGMPLAVRIVGMAHGILFVVYTWMVLSAVANRGWSITRAGQGFFAGLLPFGTFWFERKLRHSTGA